MQDSTAVKLETRINGNLAPSVELCNFNTRFPGGPENRTDNSRDTFRDEIAQWNKIENKRNNKELMEIDNDKLPPVVMNMTDCAGLQYDWRLRLSRLNMTDFDLTKYDWRRRECGGGSGDYDWRSSEW
jgi:hypothetical protein